MIDLYAITGDQILAISSDWPELLFSGPDRVERETRTLVKRFHPDVGGSDDVFHRIMQLRDAGIELAQRGYWRTPGELRVTGDDGKTRIIRYHKAVDFGLGTAYIGVTKIAYAIHIDYADLAENASRTVGAFDFPSAEI